MYLGVHHEWKIKVSEEIRSFIAKYASPSDGADTKLSTTTVASRLSCVPPSVWEDEMPITELCLRETIRLVQSSVFLRRNVSDKDIVIDERRIEPGTFVVYPSADANHNPAIYPDPERHVEVPFVSITPSRPYMSSIWYFRWDPARYLREEDKKQSHGFVGWGGGE
jgi:sterol 14-demethylase